MAMSNITYKPHCNYARMTCTHNYAQCCDGVGGEKAWSTLAASASGGGDCWVCGVAALGHTGLMSYYALQMCGGHLT